MTSNDLIPTIDISRFTTGRDTPSVRVAKQVARACEETGFLVVTGHDVPLDAIARMHNVCRDFFDLSLDTKGAYELSYPGAMVGYQRSVGSLAYSLDERNAPPDLRESFATHPIDIDRSDPYYMRGWASLLYQQNPWPAEIPGFRDAWVQYYAHVERLATTMMRVFAVALELPCDYFDSRCNRHFSTLAAYNYPEQVEAPKPGQRRGGEHTDFGSLTLVHSDWSIAGGLQVKHRTEGWMDVPNVPGAFVANIGDLMAQWTNDKWVSTLHRVANPPRKDAATNRRQSLVFFFNPNYDQRVECLETCLLPGEAYKYEPYIAGRHHLEKLHKMFGLPLPPE